MLNSFALDSHQICEANWEECQLSQKLNNDSQEYQVFNQQAQQSTITSSSQMQQSGQKKKSKNSKTKDSNPNLLKNLVVILRSWVQIKEGINNCSKYEMEIWNHFKKSKKINKYLLWTVYGSIKEQPNQYQKLTQAIPILKQLSIDQFQKIQKQISVETLIQLKRADLNYILKYRRVKDRVQFEKYFYDFVHLLENAKPYSKKIKEKESSN